MRKWMPAIALVVLVASASQAAIVQFDLATEYSGGTSPAGSPAWLRATADDGGGTGSVALKIESLNLVDSEFVTKFHMNLDDSLNEAALAVSAPTKVGSFADPIVSFGTDAFSSAGSRKFDVEVLFDNSPPANRFGAGESVLFTITGAGITANSFAGLSTGVGSPLSISAHVQGIGANANLSGWITTVVPEPMSLSLVGIGSLLFMRRR